ncbi:alpha-ketoglutarate-dependent dioxygenase AlkB family protein [Streptomonospora nanhaiensis]|uniref:Alkylated DNA repair protein (DNA oxidative demethylase) n=1 Tax=Streptomonospora nanhaiensis TaxID=1323731 RepID=A0A853BHL4_9ACTN|nr:alpha-ketoglutarate-dependent dioxygenase AlkB [Streptomonospora nanhaiensis]NYI94026.1 alkylated DNA repair protein (DNA oxidative demethylase) [Streptomonospora nanhaiensis]
MDGMNAAGGSLDLFGGAPREVAPGAVHVPGWLDTAAQRDLVALCREWASGPAGMRRHRMPRGGLMSVRMAALGWYWEPYRYSRTLPDGSPVRPFPDLLGRLAREGVAAAYGSPPAPGSPPYDVALVNFYDAEAKMGMHQDRDERADAPVVSLSLGDTCVFRFGNTETRTRPYTDVELASGDLFVFGGPSRLAYHGVPRTRPGTAPPGIGLEAGRLNITVRASGLPGAEG